MTIHSIESKTAKDTQEWGARLARFVNVGDVVLLEGSLGAGKTTFIQGLTAQLKVKQEALSPTFVIAQTLMGTIPIHHIDFYRLNKKELLAMGIQDYLMGTGMIEPGLVLIEWAERFPEIWPAERLLVHLQIAKKSTARKISFKPIGLRYKKIVEKIIPSR